MKKISVALFVVTFFAHSNAFAEYRCESAYMEKSFDCAENAVRVERKRLNKVYMNKYRKLSVRQKARMDANQKQWLRKRIKKCGTGEIAPSTPMNNFVVHEQIGSKVCIANMNRKRTNYLLKH